MQYEILLKDGISSYCLLTLCSADSSGEDAKEISKCIIVFKPMKI